jgi:hypothetical protein
LDGHRVTIFKPNCDSCVKLASRGHFLINNDYFWRLKRVGHLRKRTHETLLTLWQSATPIKKLSIKSRKSPIPRQSKARNFWSRKTYSANYARLQRPRPKSGLSTSHLHRSHRASKRSSRPEKFVSRFFARSTLSAVSVTVTGLGSYRVLARAHRMAKVRS